MLYILLDRSLSSAVFCPKLKHKSIVLKHLFNQGYIVHLDQPPSANVLERT